MRKRSYDYRTSRWRKPQSLTAFRAPTPSAAIVRQSMNSLTGAALRRDYRLARPWWSVPNAPGIAAPAPSTINLRLGAVRRLAYEAADYGLLTRGLGCGNTACQGREEAWCQVGQSVNTRAGKSALAGTRSRAAPRQARPCPPGNSSGLWSPAA